MAVSSGLPQNGDVVLVAQKKDWFKEGGEGLKGDVDWMLLNCGVGEDS